MCEICSKLTIKTPERRQRRRPSNFNVDFEQVNVGWNSVTKNLVNRKTL